MPECGKPSRIAVVRPETVAEGPACEWSRHHTAERCERHPGGFRDSVIHQHVGPNRTIPGFQAVQHSRTARSGWPPPPAAATTTTARKQSVAERKATARARDLVHLPDTRRVRRSAIDTSDSVTSSSFHSERQMRSSPVQMASIAALSSRPQMHPNTPAVRLRIR
jgi:hypothetical protein